MKTLVALLLLFPRLALAQPDEQPQEPVPPPEDAASTEARAAAAFEGGKRSFEEDDYTSALASFEEAQSLAPHDVVRFNIALCLERLARFRRAFDEYEHAAASAQLDETTRADATERAARVRARLGTVVIEGPASATVEVVGVETCTAPCRVLVDPGPYQVRRTDLPAPARPVTVERGAERSVTFVEEPENGERDRPSRRGSFQLRLGPVGWIGAAAAAVGLVGTIAFGLRAESLHDHYLEHPTRDRYDSGRSAVLVTNLSIGLAVLGAAAFVVDVFVLQRKRGAEESPAPRPLALAF